MQTFDDPTRQNSLCKEVYRYKAKPIYAIHEVVDDACKIVHKLHAEKGLVTGYPTGLRDLDYMLYGLQPGSMTVLASWASMGKSALALNIVQNLSVNNTVPTAIFSLETSKEHLVIRMLATVAHADSVKARIGCLSEADLLKLNGAKKKLQKSSIYIDDTSGISITELLAKVIRLKVDHNIQVIVIDSLQLMRDDSRLALTPIEMSKISSSLKVLARELDIAIILLSQLNSSTVKWKVRKRGPRLSDLGNTGSLEDDADVILFLHREAVYCKHCRRRDGTCVHNHERSAEIIIAKNKNGPIGTVCVNFYGETMRFADLC